MLDRAVRHPLLVATVVAALTFLHRPAGAAWQLNGSPICTQAQWQHSPVILPSLDGSAIIVWNDYRFGNGDIYAQRVDSTGAVLWSVDGVAVCGDANEQNEPAAVQAFGGAGIVWSDGRVLGGAPYAQVLDVDGISQLMYNGIKLTSAPYAQAPVIISDGVFSIGVPIGFDVGWREPASHVGFAHFDGTGGKKRDGTPASPHMPIQASWPWRRTEREASVPEREPSRHGAWFGGGGAMTSWQCG